MSAARTILAVALLCAASPAAALPRGAAERAEIFAVCAGTWRAEAEQGAPADGAGPAAAGADITGHPGRSAPGPDAAAARADAFAALLEAVTPDAHAAGLAPARLRAVRTQAWLVHRALLDRAAFAGPGAHRAGDAARAAALRRRERCDALLLGA